MTEGAIGERVRLARTRLGMTQEELGRAIGGDRSTISKIESGQRSVKSVELADLADALGQSMRDLIGRRKPLAPLAFAHRIAGAGDDDEGVGKARRALVEALELQALLDELEIPSAPQPAPVEVAIPATSDPVAAGLQMAGEVRRVLGLGTAPIGDLAELAGRHFGVEVLGLPLGDGPDTIAGMCTAAPALRAAVVNTDHWPTRQRFTLAHELGHILFGDPGDGAHVDAGPARTSDPVEVRANTFAAELLVPRVALQLRVPTPSGLDEAAFTHLFFDYGVSVEMLVRQLVAAAILAPHECAPWLVLQPSRLALLHNRREAYADQERDRGGVRAPDRLYERALGAYLSGRIGVGPLAGLLRREPDELRAELTGAGLAPDLQTDADVLELL